MNIPPKSFRVTEGFVFYSFTVSPSNPCIVLYGSTRVTGLGRDGGLEHSILGGLPKKDTGYKSPLSHHALI